jgi:hypothetical protein
MHGGMNVKLFNSPFCLRSFSIDFYGYKIKQRLFSYTTLSDLFLNSGCNLFALQYLPNL